MTIHVANTRTKTTKCGLRIRPWLWWVSVTVARYSGPKGYDCAKCREAMKPTRSEEET